MQNLLDGFLTPGDSWVCGFVVWSALYLAQFMWARRLRASGDAAAKECDAANSTAPRVAFCISGLARSFATPFMLDQHWQLLVRPLAPDASDRKADHGHRISLHLKSDRSSQSASIPTILLALERGWSRPMLGEAVVLTTGVAR